MAGRISDEDIQKVREASDIVSVMGEVTPVKQKGRDFWCCCPFHQEKTPSCKIDPALQLFHCFGCGEGGDVFSFIMKREDMSYPEAVRYLAQRAHIDIAETGGGPSMPASRKARLKAVCAEAADFYHLQLMRGTSDGAAAARAYLGGRGLGGSVAKTWKLGFAPGRESLVRHLSAKGFKADEMVEANVATRARGGRLRDRFFDRAMFPINDAAGDCIAFGGRILGQGEPKYLNSQETPLFRKGEVLYGLDKAKAAMASTGTAVVVEGYTDVIALHNAGFTNAVATLGTALTRRHIRILSRHAGKRIIYLFDGDAAGQRAADRALEFIDESMTPEAGRSRTELLAVTLPDNLDPADFLEQRGASAMEEQLEGARPLIAFGIDRRLNGADIDTAEGRTKAIAEAVKVLAPIKDSLLAKDYAIQIAGRMRAREQDVLDLLARQTVQPAADEGHSAEPTPRRRPSDPAKVNRLRFEREFLTVLAHYPDLAALHADALVQTVWQDQAHAAVARAMEQAMEQGGAPDASELVGRCLSATPHAADVLSAASPPDNPAKAAEEAAFLAEELSLADAEDMLAALRAELAGSPSDDPAAKQIFDSLAGMQADIARRRKGHRPKT